MSSIKEELQGIKSEVVQIEQALGSMDMHRQRIRSEFKLDEMRARLLAIPNEIQALQKEIVLSREATTEPEEFMKQREAEIMFEIGQETNGDEKKPKPKFSNETARKAESIRRLKEDTEYQEAKGKLEDSHREQLQAEIQIDRLKKEFQVQMAFKDLAVAEMNLLGA